MQIIKIRSTQREQLLDVTDNIERRLIETGSTGGVCTLFVQHTTAGLTINENSDPDVQHDLLKALRTLVPQHGMGFRHSEGNSDAHIKSSLVGASLTIPFQEGRLVLGRWQAVFLCEFDGPRERTIIMVAR